MPLTPEANDTLYADASGLSLEAQLSAALQHNVAEGLATGSRSDSLATLAAVAIAESQVPKASASGIEAITSIDALVSFESMLTTTDRLFSRIDVTAPTVEELIASGVNFAGFGQKFDHMTSSGLEPVWSLVPALSLDNWKRIFSDLRQDDTIQNNPLANKGGDDGLWVHGGIQSVFHNLSTPPVSAPLSVTDDGILWTLRLIPGTDRPIEKDVTHEYGRHPDKMLIQEYLTLQASRIQNGQAPVDKDTFTHLKGAFAVNRREVLGDWRKSDGLVYVDWWEFDTLSAGVGMRVPVWAN